MLCRQRFHSIQRQACGTGADNGFKAQACHEAASTGPRLLPDLGGEGGVLPEAALKAGH